MSDATSLPPVPGAPFAWRYAHYEVLRHPGGHPWQLGQGGMGITYKALDTRLQVHVALKVIHPHLATLPDVQRLFVREARAAARILHPNVAPVVFLSDEPGRLFYAMEFVDGRSLHAWMRAPPAGQPRKVALALAFAEQIARGLQAVHEQGIIHRDLKPANIMVVEFPEGHPRRRALAASGGCLLKIIDFGLARGAGAQPGVPMTVTPETSGFRGTATYASPEQCNESPQLDGRSDLYSLGCILWELLAGRPPFDGRSHFELLRQHLDDDPPWALLAKLPPAAQTVLKSLLAKRREDRPPHAAAAADAILDATAEAGGGLVAPTGRTASVSAPSSRATTPAPITVTIGRHHVVGFAFAAFAVVAAVGGLAYWLRGPGGPLPDLNPKSSGRATQSMRRVIAVLPFENRGGEKDNEIFTEGIHEDIITSLAKVREIRVIARSSVMKYRATTRDLREVGRELGATAVLEGSVRREGTRVRVSTRLVDATSGHNLWAESFDREVTDVFEIQAAVARELATALAATLTLPEQRAIAKRPTVSVEAYEVFVRARSAEQRGPITADTLREMLPLYERCVQLDPKFAQAHARLSIAHSQMYWFAVDQTPARIALARSAAERAAELQPGLADAHVALGEIYYRLERNWKAALREYQIALAIEPSNVVALDSAGLALRRLGQWPEAVKLLEEAAQLAPNDARRLMSLAELLFNVHRFAEADRIGSRVLELTDDPYWESLLLLLHLETRDDWEGFVKRYREIIPRMPPDLRFELQLIISDHEGALSTLAGLPDTVRFLSSRYPKALVNAIVHERMGNALAAPEFAEAVRQAEATLATKPDDALLRAKYATALAGAGRREDALWESARAMELLPETSDPVFGRYVIIERALIHLRFGDAAEATRLLRHVADSGGTRLCRGMLRHYPEFASLRGYPPFDEYVSHK